MEHAADSPRREFLLRTLGIAGTVVASSSLLGLMGCEKDDSTGMPVTPNPTDPKTLVLDTSQPAFAVLAAPGGAIAVDYPLNGVTFKVLVYRKSNSQAVCLNRICTHQGCDLDPRMDGNISGDKITCGCHGSQFEVNTGAVVQGPANRALTSYPVTLDGANIKISFA